MKAESKGHRPGLALGVSVALGLAAVGVVVVVISSPPAAQPASAPEGEFSAVRAMGHLERIAAEPRVAGSPALGEARRYILEQLEGLGLGVEVRSGLGARAGRGWSMIGAVDNVVAIVPGTDPTGRLFVVAHYDSAPGSPGAGDNGAAVAAMLEAARALRQGPPLRNDVVFVFTDAEEEGLLGAAAFVAEHPLAADGGVVLNWEARGSAGASRVFRNSPANDSGLISVLASHAPHPRGDSSTAALFELLPYDTDFSVFKEAGFAGLDSAFGEESFRYHTPQDTVANLNPNSLQHHGANMLGLVRGLGQRDLATVVTGREATFFTVGDLVIAYPAALNRPLAMAALLLMLALAIVVRWRRFASVPRMIAGMFAAVLVIVATAVAAGLFWQVLVAVRPNYEAFVLTGGDPYHPQWYRAALGALTAGLFVGWYLSARRWIGAMGVAVGALAPAGAIGLLLAWVLPGMSYQYALPALFSGAGLLAAVIVAPSRPVVRASAAAAGALPAVVLLIADGVLALPAMGLAEGAAAVVAWVVGGVLLTPLLAVVVPTGAERGAEAAPAARWRRLVRNPVWLPVALLVVGVVFAGIGLARAGFDAEHPERVDLVYVLDADEGEARWISRAGSAHPWAASYVGEAAELPADLPLYVSPRWPVRVGQAGAADLPPPAFEVLGITEDGQGRTVRVRVASRRGAPWIDLGLSAAPASLEVTAPDGRARSVPVESGDSLHRIRLSNVPEGGFDLSLRFDTSESIEARLTDRTRGLDDVPGFEPRPVAVGPWIISDSEAVLVTRTVRF